MSLPAFVINMDRSPDRLASVGAELRAAGVPFTRFPAVDGRHVDRRAPDISPWGRHFATDAMLGCGLSHVRLWRHVRDAGLPAALVMEDDVRLVPGFGAKLRAALAEVPADFDLVMLGYFELGPWPLAGAVRALTGRRPGPVSRRVLVPCWPVGFHCYVVSAKGAAALASTRVAFHIDAQVAALRGLRVYAVRPRLARQADMTGSTIAAPGFPRLANGVLTMRDGQGVPLAYYASVPFGRLGPVHVTAWVLAFFVMGYRRVPPAWVLAYFAVEALFCEPESAMRDCAAAYCAGWLVGYTALCSKT